MKILDHYIYDNDLRKDLTGEFITDDWSEEYIDKNIIYIKPIIQSLNLFDLDYSRKSILSDKKNELLKHLKTLLNLKINEKDYIKFISKDLIINFGMECNYLFLELLEKFETPKDYKYLKYAFIISQYIKENQLIYNDEYVCIKYNPFTAYGRYGLQNKSFSISNLEKSKRQFLKPESDDFMYFEFDFNAFEIRTFFALEKLPQPEGDLYKFLHEIQNDVKDRSDFKKELIINLYSNKEAKTVLKNLFKDFYENYPIIDGHVENIFGKKMETDEYHRVSRILQSSAAYILYQQMYKLLFYILTNKLKSKLSFCVYDSICLSVHKSEFHLIPEFRNIIENVTIEELGYSDRMPVKTKFGATYGDLKLYED